MNEQPTAPLVAQPPAPPLLGKRIEAMDVLRGIAVLAAMFTSIWIIGGFTDEEQKALLLQSSGADYRLFGSVNLLLWGKMASLIALVFGASMIIFLSKDRAGDRLSTGDVFIRRQLWLIFFGLLNSLLFLWTHDFLFHLGVMGILLFPFFRMRTRGLLVAALLTTAIYCGKYYWNHADDQKSYRKYLAITALEKKFEKDSIAKASKGLVAKKDTLTKKQQEDKGAWEGLLAGMKADTKKDDPNTKSRRKESYGAVWNHLLPTAQARHADWTYRFGVWDIATALFLGMLLYKIGFFASRFSRKHYFLFALAAIGGGLLMGWFRLHYQQLALQDYTAFIKASGLPHTFLFPIEKAALALGYASLVMALLGQGRFWRALAAVGRLSLTNYLLQSIVFGILFYGFGAGYFNRLSQPALYFIVFEVILVQVIGSVLWLRYFNYGPAEWLLRRLAGDKWAARPFRKPSKEAPLPILS